MRLSASRTALSGSSTKRACTICHSFTYRSRAPGASGRISSSSRRAARAESSFSASRRLSASSTVRSYSGPKRPCRVRVRLAASARQTTSATTTTAATAIRIQPQAGIRSSLLDYTSAARGSRGGTAARPLRFRPLPVVAENHFRDADRLVPAVALDGGRHRRLEAPVGLLDGIDAERPANPRAGRDRSREADTVQAVVDPHAGLLPRHDLV